MIFVDSSVWIANLRNLDTPQVGLLRRLDDEILVGDLVLAEVLRGARDEANARRIETDLRRFEQVSVVDDEIAVKAARYYRRLRQLGFTIRSTVDLLIGTFCVEYGYALLHDDRDFDPMAAYLGLQTATPSGRAN